MTRYTRNLILFLLFSLSLSAQYTVQSKHIQQPELNIDYVKRNAEFWISHAFDPVYGGFYSNVDRYGNVQTLQDVRTGKSYKRKSLIAQTRQGYGMTRAFMLTGDEKYLTYAKSALDFLTTYGWDNTNEGWYCFSREDGSLDNGQWWDPNTGKWGFQQHYALVGLIANYEATHNIAIKQWVDKGINALNNHMWDSRIGYEGYYADAALNWTSPSGKGFTPTVDAITTNAELIYLITQNQSYKNRLLELSDIIVNRFMPNLTDARFKALYPENYTSDWVLNYNSTDGSIGHFLKTAWCLGRAYLCDTTKTAYKNAAIQILDQSWNYQNGAVSIWDHVNGGPFNAINMSTGGWGSSGDNKDYWTIEQGFTGPMINYYITKNDNYLQMADESLKFFMEHQVDSVYGEIFSELSPDGKTVRSAVKGDDFKACYHSIELGYYAYLYSNLYYLHKPATLYYKFAPATETQTIALNPIPIQNELLKIKTVQLNGTDFSNFDKDKRTITILPNQGGTFKVTFENAMAINTGNNETNTRKVLIYPNPARSYLNISNCDDIQSISISNISGNTLSIIRNDQNSFRTIDIDKLQPGIYFVTMQTNSGQKIVEKIVKQ